MAKNTLTLKQEKFCLAYFETGNASEAYRAVYNISRMKPETVNRAANQLTSNYKITTRLQELLAPTLEKLEVKTEKTLKRLMQGQEFDVRRLYHQDGELKGKLKQPWELDDDTAKAVVGVKYDSLGNLTEYKIIDVKGCAELVGKHLKLFTEKFEHAGKDGGPMEHRMADVPTGVVSVEDWLAAKIKIDEAYAKSSVLDTARRAAVKSGDISD